MWLIFGRGKKEIRVRVSADDLHRVLKHFSVGGVKQNLKCHFCVERPFCAYCRLGRQLPSGNMNWRCAVIPGLVQADAAGKRDVAILRNFRKRIMRAVERGKR